MSSSQQDTCALNPLKRPRDELEVNNQSKTVNEGDDLKKVELRFLPLLSHLDKEMQPVRAVYNIWSNGIKDQRPLRDAFEKPREDYMLFDPKTRGPCSTAYRIRYTCLVLSLISSDPEESIEALESYKKRQKLSLRELAGKIQKKLANNGLTR